MLQAFQRTPQKSLPIQPLPILAVADQGSSFDIFETDLSSPNTPITGIAHTPVSRGSWGFATPDNGAFSTEK